MAALLVAIVATCLDTAALSDGQYGAPFSCSDIQVNDEFGACKANTKLQSAIAEHTSTDHFSTVQIKATKLGADEVDEFSDGVWGGNSSDEAWSAEHHVAYPAVFWPDGNGSVPYYRIPALLLLNQGLQKSVLLAFAEKRYSYSDAGRIEVVMKRSDDGGSSWGSEVTVCAMGYDTCGNPAPVEDNSGRVHLLVSSNPADQGEMNGGWAGTLSRNAKRQVWHLHSDDGGNTWSEPSEITSSVKLNKWLWYATGPGHGIKLSKQVRGNLNGRLIVGADHSEIVGDWVCYSSHLIYSDDNGMTWAIQDPWQLKNHPNANELGCRRSSESSIVETKNGKLFAFSRQLTRKFTRFDDKVPSNPAELVQPLFAASHDGGSTWGELHHGDLYGKLPSCQGAMVNHVYHDGQERVFLSHPSRVNETTGRRENMRIYVSFDRGRTFPAEQSTFVNRGPAGYSDMQVLQNGTVVILFEEGSAGLHLATWRPDMGLHS